MDLSVETLRKITQADHVQLKAIAAKVERLESGLRKIEAHHKSLNRMMGRPLSHSKTLALCAEAMGENNA